MKSQINNLIVQSDLLNAFNMLEPVSYSYLKGPSMPSKAEGLSILLTLLSHPQKVTAQIITSWMTLECFLFLNTLSLILYSLQNSCVMSNSSVERGIVLKSAILHLTNNNFTIIWSGFK